MRRPLSYAFGLSLLAAVALHADEGPIEISKDANFMGNTPPTPISITGFSGEVASALRFDLTVMGFTNVPPDQARYILSGSNDASVRGQLSLARSVGKSGTVQSSGAAGQVLFSKEYSGASIRAQAHRLSDDVVLKLTGVNGIAETRVALKVDSGPHSEIFVSDYDGHNAQSVTRDNSIVAAPCWVPGKLALYYTSYVPGKPDIYYQDLSSGQRRNFSHYPGLNSSAAVSHDGRVAMILSKGGSPDLYVCNPDGTGLKQLTRTREDESSPCWSPDGHWICYASKVNERRGLYKISSDGGDPQRINTAGFSSPSEPDWSPDGNWIVFTSQNGAGFNICVTPSKGGAAVLLVAGEDPSWAPNSRNVIFARRSGGNRVLSLLDVPTKQVKDVSRVSGSASNSQPSWAR